LPFIEPSFVVALIFGLLLCLPVPSWIQKMFPSPFDEHNLRGLLLQVMYDVAMILIFLAGLAAAASATYQPGIYGTF
jgi:hypothetical protein